MTLREVCTQILDITVDRKINDVKRTVKSFMNYVESMFRVPLLGKNHNQLCFGVWLPDGGWYCYIVKLDNGEWDYYIPETREQEEKNVKSLFRR